LKEETKEVQVCKYGIHSIRKGSYGYAVSCSTYARPLKAAATNIMGWTTGTGDKYEAAEDQFLGGVFCGLNVKDESFAVLPPTYIQI